MKSMVMGKNYCWEASIVRRLPQYWFLKQARFFWGRLYSSRKCLFWCGSKISWRPKNVFLSYTKNLTWSPRPHKPEVLMQKVPYETCLTWFWEQYQFCLVWLRSAFKGRSWCPWKYRSSFCPDWEFSFLCDCCIFMDWESALVYWV